MATDPHVNDVLGGAGFRFGLGLALRGGGVGSALVDALAQLLAGAEEDSALGLHRDDLARLRVAAVVTLVVLDVKGAEAADFDVVALTKRSLHRVEDRLDGLLRLLLGQLPFGHENGDQVTLQHAALAPRRAARTGQNVLARDSRYPKGGEPGKRQPKTHPGRNGKACRTRKRRVPRWGAGRVKRPVGPAPGVPAGEPPPGRSAPPRRRPGASLCAPRTTPPSP